jgi:hypothetical protein
LEVRLLSPASGQLRLQHRIGGLSATGKTFSVTVHDGRITKQNVKPLGFVFDGGEGGDSSMPGERPLAHAREAPHSLIGCL